MKANLQHRPLSCSTSPARVRGFKSEIGSVSGRRRTQTTSHSHNSDSKFPPLTLARMERLGQDWLLEGEASYHSPKTKAIRATALRNLAWYVRKRYESPDENPQDEIAREKIVIDANVVRNFLR